MRLGLLGRRLPLRTASRPVWSVNAASTKVLFWTDVAGKDELRSVGINGGATTVVPLPTSIEPGSASWSFAR